VKSYARFYPKLFNKLQKEPPFSSREEAGAWLREAWCAIHVEAGASKRRIAIMKNARICKEQGWKDVEKDVCYLESPEKPPLRLFLHRNGSIVLQQMFTERNEIIFAKPGKVIATAI
jgi:hypothetical protein